MIKTAKAYRREPRDEAAIKELKVVCTGTDVAAQVAAIDNFINSGYDAIVTIAVNPTAFGPVIKRANKAGVVLVPFDNVSRHRRGDDGQRGPEARWAGSLGRWLTQEHPVASGQDPRGARRARQLGRPRPPLGFREVLEGAGQQVRDHRGRRHVGRRHGAEGHRRRAGRAQAFRRHLHAGRLDRHGAGAASTPSTRSSRSPARPRTASASCAPSMPRTACVCASAGQSPGAGRDLDEGGGQRAAGQGHAAVHLGADPATSRIRTSRTARTTSPNLTDNFFTPNEFPPCGVNMTATDDHGEVRGEPVA